MLFLAVSALDKMKDVPPKVWLYVALGIAGFIAFVFAIRWLAGVNRIYLAIATFVVCGLVFFSWVYNRNEPAFLTPLVDRIAPFFPTAGSYGRKQEETPGDDKQKKKQDQKQPAIPPSHVY
jgi:hypothetical protein